MPPPIAAPVDKPYAGPIALTVDLTNIVDRVEHVHEDIPVERGAREIVLLYPEWIPRRSRNPPAQSRPWAAL